MLAYFYMTAFVLRNRTLSVFLLVCGGSSLARFSAFHHQPAIDGSFDRLTTVHELHFLFIHRSSLLLLFLSKETFSSSSFISFRSTLPPYFILVSRHTRIHTHKRLDRCQKKKLVQAPKGPGFTDFYLLVFKLSLHEFLSLGKKIKIEEASLQCVCVRARVRGAHVSLRC